MPELVVNTRDSIIAYLHSTYSTTCLSIPPKESVLQVNQFDCKDFLEVNQLDCKDFLHVNQFDCKDLL